MKQDSNEYWRQALPLNEELDFETQMKIIKEEREFQEQIDIENYESINLYKNR